MPGRDAVAIERLRLQGFGRHRDLELHFPAGLATWVATNEAGKSTAILGLVATLCGVPHLQEASGFTWGRFRSHHGGPHRGEVDLRRADSRYRVERGFDQHRVRVLRHTPAGPEVLFDGEHNPNARREVSGYSRWLRATLGIDDAGLLLSTFVVAQGDLAGSPQQLSERVQALLAGAGGSTAADALARLEGSLRGVTRKLRDASPRFSRDGRSDQPLELAEARLADLMRQHREGAALADELANLQRAAERASGEARAALRDAQRARALANARQSWLERRDATLRGLRRARELARALQTARELEGGLAQARAELERTHPELAPADPATLDDRIAAWLQAEEALASQQLRRQRAQEALTAAEQEAAAAVSDPDTPPATGGAVVEGEALRQHQLAQAAGQRYQQTLAQAAQLRAQLREAEEMLERLAPLHALAPEALAALAGYRQEAARLRTRLEAAGETHADWARALAEAHERFGDVAGLSSEAAAGLRALKLAHLTPDPAEPWRWLGALLLSGSLAALGVMLALDPLLVAVGALAGGGLWALAWPRQPRLARVRRTLRRLAAVEPVLQGDDAHHLELADRHAALLNHGEEIERFAAGEREAAQRLAGAQERWDAFEERWRPLQRALRPGGGRDVDLQAAAEALPVANKQRAAALEQGARLAAAAGVASLDQLADGAPAAASGPDGARLLEYARARAGRAGDALVPDAAVADLQRWLAAAEGEWAKWRLAAEREDAAAQRAAERQLLYEQLRQQLSSLAQVVAEERAGEAQRDEELVRAREAAHSGLNASLRWPAAAELRQAWRQRSALLNREAAQAQQLHTHVRAVGAESVAGLYELATHADYELRRQHEAWQALLAEHPDLPPADLELSADLDLRHGPFAAAAEGATQAEAAAERARGQALAEAEALARAQGTDPIDVAAVELEIEELRQEIAALRFERDALAMAHEALFAASQTTLEGQARQLELAAAAQLEALSGVVGRRIRCDAEMRISAIEANGQPLSLAQLSQGARDQLALALRFAIKDLIADQVALPMILDDPFLNWDAERAAAAAAALQRLAAQGEQLWLVSHRPELAAWGEPIRVTETSG